MAKFKFSITAAETDKILVNAKNTVYDSTNKFIKLPVGDKTYAISGITEIVIPVTPTITIKGNDTDASRTVNFTSTTSGVTFYYTTDGTDPKTSGSRKTGTSATVSASTSNKTTSTTIRVVAFRTGEYSNEHSVVVITSRHLGVPSISVDGNKYSLERTVTISANNTGVSPTVQYKLGSSGNWTTYSNSFKVSSNVTVYARCIKTDWENSSEVNTSIVVGTPLCYYGFSDKESMSTMGDISSLANQVGKDSIAGEYTLTSPNHLSYLWFCIPNSMSINKMTSGGFDVPLKTPTTLVTGYKCYVVDGKVQPNQTATYIIV